MMGLAKDLGIDLSLHFSFTFVSERGSVILSQLLTLGLGCAALSSRFNHSSEAIVFRGLCGSIGEGGLAGSGKDVLDFFVLTLNVSELTRGVSIPAFLTILAVLQRELAILGYIILCVCSRHVFLIYITILANPYL